MKKVVFEASHHIFHYLILLILISGGLTAFLSSRNYPLIQLLVGIVTSLSYVVWGIVHHFVDRDLSLKIVIEYLAVALFAIIVLWNVLIL